MESARAGRLSADGSTVEPPPIGLQDRQRREVVLSVEAWPERNQLKTARVEMLQPEGGVSTLVCDEGPYLGGESSAPAPLTYFSASIAFCMLTQIGRYARIMRVRLDSLSMQVTTRFRIEGSVREETIQSRPLTFSFDVQIDSSEPEDRIARLLKSAERSCYVTQSLLQPVEIERSVQVNGETLDVGSDSRREEGTAEQ